MNQFENDRVNKLLSKMTVEEKLQCLHGQMGDPYRANQVGFIRGIKRLGIPDFFLADGESGVNITWETTVFPSKVSLASTFDRKSAFKYGDAMGKEAKATGMHLLLTPRVNIARDPVALKGTSNGGNYQTYGEDPILNGVLGAEEAKGIQNKNQAMANLKQMFGSSTGAAQGAGNSVMDYQTMHELYLRPFEIVIKSGVASIMTSYNQVNGTWTYDSQYMLEDYARGKWGFKGFVFNDWYCLYDPNSLRHGVTIEMPGSDYYDEGNDESLYGKKLLKAIENPNEPVNFKDLDKAVYYYLDTLDRFGFLDEKQRLPGKLNDEIKLENIEVARDIACKGAVLLKNEDNILPLSFSNKKVAIIGPGGAQQVMPTFKESPYGFSDRKNNVYNILNQKYGDQITFSVGNDLDGEVIPSEYLKPEKGSKVNGLKRYVERFTYETLSNGDLSEIPVAFDYIIDETINHSNETKLPALKREKLKGFFKELPREYYMWHGYLCPDETGEFRLSMQSKIPGLDSFEKNKVENIDLSISTSGNLYIREKPLNKTMTRIGMGIRLSNNGTANPFSEVVQCKDGWNNAGGTVYLEKGKEYEIYFNHTNIYLEPLEIRLAWTTPSMSEKAIGAAVEIARKADVVLCFAWHQSVNESLKLAENQNKLIKSVSDSNPETVVILNTGDPIEIPWVDNVKGILQMWFSGQEGALSTVDILDGSVNPAGRLPVTFPKKLEDIAARAKGHPERYAESGRISEKNAVHPNTAEFTEGILNGYRWFDEMDIEPLFPFGFGLSYTTFEYSDIDVNVTHNGLQVKCKITNSGGIAGDEVVQCYLGRPTEVPVGIQTVPKMLVDFERIYLEPGESKDIVLNIEELYLSYFDPKEKKYIKFIGEREVMLGSSSKNILLKSIVSVK